MNKFSINKEIFKQLQFCIEKLKEIAQSNTHDKYFIYTDNSMNDNILSKLHTDDNIWSR